MALFLLTGGLLVLVQLYDTTIRHSLTIEKQHVATQAAEDVLDAVREWAEQPANFHSAWALYAGQTFTDARYPGLTTRVDVRASKLTIYSPSQDQAVSRRIYDSIVPVRVESRWDGNARGKVVLVSYIGEPGRPGAEYNASTPPSVTVTLATGASPLAVNATCDFEARLLDNTGAQIKGAVFGWVVVPRTLSPGNAMIDETTPEGDRARLTHHYPGGSGFQAVPGNITVQARARYGGKVYLGESAVIQLL